MKSDNQYTNTMAAQWLLAIVFIAVALTIGSQIATLLVNIIK